MRHQLACLLGIVRANQNETLHSRIRPCLWQLDCLDLCVHSKSIEELRSEFTLLRSSQWVGHHNVIVRGYETLSSNRSSLTSGLPEPIRMKRAG